MATETMFRGSLPRVQWAPVITGVFFAIAVQIVLGLVGAAFGFGARPADSSALGVIAVIWELVTPLAASFVGAWVAVSIARAFDTRTAYLHGVLVWCIGLIAGALFLSASVATGAMTVGAAMSGNVQARTLMQQRNAPATRGEAQAQQAGKAGAAATGFGGLAAILGLCGAVIGTAAARKSLGAEEIRPGERGYGGYAAQPPIAHAGTAGVVTPPSEVTPRPEEPLHH